MLTPQALPYYHLARELRVAYAARTASRDPVAAIVLAYVNLVASIEVDAALRLMILEGVAGVRPGTWTRYPQAKGVMVAREALPASVNEAWFDYRHSMGFTVALRRAVKNSQRESRALARMEVEELESVVMGPVSGRAFSAPYRAGKDPSLGPAILKGASPAAAIGIFNRAVYQQLIDYGRSRETNYERREMDSLSAPLGEEGGATKMDLLPSADGGDLSDVATIRQLKALKPGKLSPAASFVWDWVLANPDGLNFTGGKPTLPNVEVLQSMAEEGLPPISSARIGQIWSGTVLPMMQEALR